MTKVTLITESGDCVVYTRTATQLVLACENKTIGLQRYKHLHFHEKKTFVHSSNCVVWQLTVKSEKVWRLQDEFKDQTLVRVCVCSPVLFFSCAREYVCMSLPDKTQSFHNAWNITTQATVKVEHTTEGNIFTTLITESFELFKQPLENICSSAVHISFNISINLNFS